LIEKDQRPCPPRAALIPSPLRERGRVRVNACNSISCVGIAQSLSLTPALSRWEREDAGSRQAWTAIRLT